MNTVGMLNLEAKSGTMGTGPSSVGLLGYPPVYIDQMTKSWNSGNDQKETGSNLPRHSHGTGVPSPKAADCSWSVAC